VTVPDPDVYELGDDEDFVFFEVQCGPPLAPGEAKRNRVEFLTVDYEEYRRRLFGPRPGDEEPPGTPVR
jgi:hypothetical protein